MILPPLVMVEWEDARLLDDTAWVDSAAPTVYEPMLMYTVGFLLLDTAGGVVVTGTVNPEVIGPRDQIPRGMIRRVTLLRKAGPA